VRARARAQVKMDAAEMAKAHRLELERLGTRLESLDDKLVHTRSALEVGLEADRRASYLAVRAARDERRRLEVRLGFLAARAAECALPLERLAAISGVTIEPCLDEEGGLDARASGVQSLLERFHAKEVRARLRCAGRLRLRLCFSRALSFCFSVVCFAWLDTRTRTHTRTQRSRRRERTRWEPPACLPACLCRAHQWSDPAPPPPCHPRTRATPLPP
jgi:hypothetical protein